MIESQCLVETDMESNIESLLEAALNKVGRCAVGRVKTLSA